MNTLVNGVDISQLKGSTLMHIYFTYKQQLICHLLHLQYSLYCLCYNHTGIFAWHRPSFKRATLMQNQEISMLVCYGSCSRKDELGCEVEPPPWGGCLFYLKWNFAEILKYYKHTTQISKGTNKSMMKFSFEFPSPSLLVSVLRSNHCYQYFCVSFQR